MSLYRGTIDAAHNCISSQEGRVYCWGSNSAGQLGDGSDVGSATPVEVEGITTATKVTTGSGFSCTLLQDQTVRCWGDNNTFTLGTGDQVDAWEPIEPEGLADIVDIDGTCAVREDGEVLCWGSFDSQVPTLVEGINGTAVAIATGSSTCVLIEDGAVQCWGSNQYGQLGIDADEVDDSDDPLPVVGIDSAVSISAGANFTCAVLEDGSVWCWGRGTYHNLGKNGSSNSYAPTQVIGIDDATSVGTGLRHACATRQDGTVSCWGSNEYGEAGASTTAAVYRAWDRVLGIDSAVRVFAGSFTTCAVLEDGAVQCWGSNLGGRLAMGDLDYTLVHRTPTGFKQGGTWYSPETLRPLTSAGDIVQITSGASRSCALRKDGTADCWGSNSWDVMGLGSTDPVLTPTQVQSMSDLTHLSDFGGQMCGRHTDATVTCVGDQDKPLRLENALSVEFGYDFGCAVTVGLGLQCWGDQFDRTPTLSRGVVNVATGSDHACGVLLDGTMNCWGWTESSLGGDVTRSSVYEPMVVEGVTSARQASAGLSHTCALLDEGSVVCWGSNSDGQLGHNDGEYSRLAQDVGLTGIEQVSSGWYHTCAVAAAGTVYCWGDNAFGQVGNDDVGDALTPDQVIGITDAVQVACGMEHTCALHSDGSMSCWGANSLGQLGNGGDLSSPIPVPVADL